MKESGEMFNQSGERTRMAEDLNREKYLCINEKAAKFYNSNLYTNDNRGLEYLQQLGISMETISTFMLGYAPASGHALVDYLRSEGVSEEDMCGSMLVERKGGNLYNRHCDRVMFPVFNTQDRVIALRGRLIGCTIDNTAATYLTTWNKLIMPMRLDAFFGLNITKKDIESEGRAIVVEGCRDMIMLYQNGVKNVTAAIGSGMTDSQAKLLCSFSKNIVISYDSDQAGANAAARDAETIAAAGGNSYIVQMGNSKDPAEFIEAHDKGAFIRLVDDAVKKISVDEEYLK